MNKIILTLIFLLCFVAQGFAASQDRLPTGMGDAATWTANGCTETTGEWACVDDPIGTPDETTTYLSVASTNAFEYFTYPAFSISSTAIASVQVTFRCRWVNDGGGDGIAMSGRIKVGGTVYQVAGNALTTSWANYTVTWNDNPNIVGTDPWLEADVEGTGSNPIQQFGFGTQTVGAGEHAECTQNYITVNYTAAPTNNLIRFDGEDW